MTHNDTQPVPVANDHPAIWPIIIENVEANNEMNHDVRALFVADMRERHRLGTERYAVALQPHNGRDALVDAYQEALDLAAYLRQAYEERTHGVFALYRSAVRMAYEIRHALYLRDIR